MPIKVYIVMSGYNGDTNIEEIFTQKELAQQYIDFVFKDYRAWDVRIEEHYVYDTFPYKKILQ